MTLAPRDAFARAVAETSAPAHDRWAPRAYVVYYIVFVSVLAAACAAYSAAGRITAGQILGLSLSWMFLPILHALTARLVIGRRVGLFLTGHAPWSLWILAAALMSGAFGYAAYWWMVLLAIVPGLVTLRIVFWFCIEVLGLSRGAAWRRTLLHQSMTFVIGVLYLERAVSLIPRIEGLFA